jgi:predicted acyltransferase (DUF342 family)
MIDKGNKQKQTLVEEGTELKGTLKSSCPVVVNGTIDGELSAPELTVTATGAVMGSIKAEKLRSEGTLSGDIDAGDVYLSGQVKSNTVLRARSLEVKLAPARGKLELTFGECMLEVGDEPSVSDAVDDRATSSASVEEVEEQVAAKSDDDEEASATPDESWSVPPAKPNGMSDSVAPPAE